MKREWMESLHAHGLARGDLASYLFCAITTLTFVNCAHQSDDDYMRNSSSHPRQQVMIAPPRVPPSSPTLAPAPAPKAPAVKEAQVASPSLPKPKVSPAPAPKAEKAPNLSGLQLKMSNELTPPLRRLINNAEENLKKGKILEARSQADRAYRMDLRDPRTSFLMAKVSAAEKDYEGAEQWAMRALENIDDEGDKQVVWGLIARVREKNGNKVGAAEAMKKRNEFRR